MKQRIAALLIAFVLAMGLVPALAFAASEDAVSAQEDAVSMQEDAVSMQEDTVGMQEDAVSMQEDTVGMQEDAVSVQEDTASVQEDAVSPQEDSGIVSAEASKNLRDCSIKFTDKQHKGKNTDRWQAYYVTGKKTEVEPSFDLYYNGKKVAKSAYTVSYKLTWYDESKGKDVFKKASKLVPSGSPDVAGSAEYRIFVKAKSGKGFVGTFSDATICVVDRNNIGRFTDFILSKAKKSWHYARMGMDDKYYVIPQAEAKSTLNSLKLKNGGKTIAKKNYTVSYYKAKKNVVKDAISIEKAKTGKKLKKMPTTAGSYVMVIKGKNPCYGTQCLLFDIQDSISKVSVARIANQKYTGNAITPKLTVKYKGTTLKEGKDYTVTYKNNVQAGTATAEITGCNKVYTFEYDPNNPGNFIVEKNKQRFFTGTKSITFQIVE